jgi:hypothetical protein
MKIIRIKPRPGGTEEPVLYARGYQLADRSLGAEWHHVKNAIFTQTIEAAADLIEGRGLFVRMGCKGKRPSLISPRGLQIIR